MSARFEAILDSTPDLVIVIDREDDVTYVNVAVTRLVGRECGDRLCQSIFEFMHPDDACRVAEVFVRLRDTPAPVSPFEMRLRRQDNSYRTFEVSANKLLDDFAAGGIVLNCRDITDRRGSEVSMQEAEARFEQVFEAARVGMSIATLDGRFLRVNSAYCRMLGYSASEVLSTTIFEMSEPQEVDRYRELFASLVAGDVDEYRIDKRLRHADGSLLWVHIAASIVRDGLGRPKYAIGLIADTSKIHELTEELERRASHDFLTGLSARSVLPDHLERCLGQIPRSGQSIAVLAIDLDHFKAVNDGLGHQAGDEVLIEVARRLEALVRVGDLVVRLGGDEFVVVLAPTAGVETATEIAARVVASIARPIRVSAGEARIGASVGIAVAVSGNETPDLLLTQADRAAYRAKQHGRGRYELGSNDFHRLTR